MQEVMSMLSDSGIFTRDTTTLLGKVRALVLDGTYAPGELVPEQVLATNFEVSRTPIREALKQLENEGLVEIRPRVGTFVRIPTRREIIELFEVKESLEGLGAGLMARRTPAQELKILRENIERSEAAVAAGDHDEHARLVHEFHWTIMLGADNTKLLEHYDRLMNQLTYHRIVLRTLNVPGRPGQSTHEHDAVYEAIAAKDPFAAEAAMRNHVHASSRLALTEPSETREEGLRP